MQDVRSNLFTRPDTFFGACQGLGDDLGFHPNLLRFALAGLLFWNPTAALATYAALCGVVALSRWLIPVPSTTAVRASTDAASHVPSPATDFEQEELPLAA